MRQVFLDKGIVAVKQVCQPLLKDDCILINVQYSCISSDTELTAISHPLSYRLWTNIPHKISEILTSIATNGTDDTTKLIQGKMRSEIQSLGFSCSGRVIAVGNKVRSIRTGDFVACAGAGKAHHADVICAPENVVVKISDEKFVQSASITTMGAIALQAIRRAQIQLSETIAVFGLGILGQLIIKLAKQTGCNVIGIDVLPKRIEQAKKVGADHVYNATSQDMKKEILTDTLGQGVDCTFIATDSKDTTIIQNAMHITRKRGKIILVGDVDLKIEPNPFYQKEIDFLVSSSYGPGKNDPDYEHKEEDYPLAYVRWTEKRNMQAFVQLVEKGIINVQEFNPHITSIDNAEEAYDLVKSKQSTVALLTYDSSKEQKGPSIATPTKRICDTYTFIPAKKTAMRVGFVGFGGFAKVQLFPIVSRLKNISINAVVDPNIGSSLSAIKKFGTAQLLSNDTDLFNQNLVDVVIIASPHRYHCDQALNALSHGRAVFVEKPMVTDFEQLTRMKNFLDTNKTAPFCVDYNRSFAPFIKKIKEATSTRKGPLMMQYRFNAGLIPKDHWMQSEVGAGRIIGEACHIVDLFHYLTDAQPLSVSVESLHAQQYNLFPTDNFSAQISFSDGSICTLLYTSLGHHKASREYCEIFFDSKTIIMDDYKVLQGFGLPWSFSQKTSQPDRGHETLVTTFFENLNKETFIPPINNERLYSVAKTTLIIDQLACQGGGEKEL